jgi:hypothetical protein
MEMLMSGGSEFQPSSTSLMGGDLLLYFPGESRITVVSALETARQWNEPAISGLSGFSDDWSGVLGNQHGEVLFYRSSDGHTVRADFMYELGKLTVNAEHDIHEMSSGWTSLFSAWNTPFFYNANSGRVVVHYDSPSWYPIDSKPGMHQVAQAGEALVLTNGSDTWLRRRLHPTVAGPSSWDGTDIRADRVPRANWTHVVSNGTQTLFLDAALTGSPGIAAAIVASSQILTHDPFTFQGSDLSRWDAVYCVGGMFVFADFVEGKLQYATVRPNGAGFATLGEVRDKALIETGRSGTSAKTRVLATATNIPAEIV